MFGKYGLICGLCNQYNGYRCMISGKTVCPLSLCHVERAFANVRSKGAWDFTFIDGHWIQNRLLGEYLAATADM